MRTGDGEEVLVRSGLEVREGFFSCKTFKSSFVGRGEFSFLQSQYENFLVRVGGVEILKQEIVKEVRLFWLWLNGDIRLGCRDGRVSQGFNFKVRSLYLVGLRVIGNYCCVLGRGIYLVYCFKSLLWQFLGKWIQGSKNRKQRIQFRGRVENFRRQMVAVWIIVRGSGDGEKWMNLRYSQRQ